MEEVIVMQLQRFTLWLSVAVKEQSIWFGGGIAGIWVPGILALFIMFCIADSNTTKGRVLLGIDALFGIVWWLVTGCIWTSYAFETIQKGLDVFPHGWVVGDLWVIYIVNSVAMFFAGLILLIALMILCVAIGEKIVAAQVCSRSRR